MTSALSFFVTRFLARLSVGLIIFWFCGTGALAARRDSVSEHFCSTDSLVRRTGTESCWAQLALAPLGTVERSLCISHRLWLSVLTSGKPLCGYWKGRWQARSFSVNRPEQESKRVEYWFFAEELPTGKSPSVGLSLNDVMLRRLERLREQCSELFRKQDRFGILRKLLLNESISYSQSETDAGLYHSGVLRLLGFVHLYTASGIHLYSLALCIHSFCLALARMLGVPLWIMIPGAKILSGLGWCFVWVLSGMRPGLLRPWIVVVLREFARFFGFRWRFWSPLALALLVDGAVELFRDRTVMSGRWHYALAVGGGLLAMELLPTPRGKKKEIKELFYTHVSLSLGSWLFTAALDSWQLGLVATLTPLLSLLTLPLISSVFYPAMAVTVGVSLSGAVELAHIFADRVGQTMSSFIEVLATGALERWTLWCVPQWALLLGGAAACCVLVLKRWKRPYVMLGVIFLALFLRVTFFMQNFFSEHTRSVVRSAQKIEQLDVGQGDSALVNGKTWAGLIDAGSERALSFDAWMRIFSERGISRLNWIALTHLDEDHAGGVRRLIRLMPVNCVAMSPLDFLSPRGESLTRELRLFGIRVAVWGDRGCFPFAATALPSHHSRKMRNEHMSALWVPVRSKKRSADYLSMGDANPKQEDWGTEWFLKQREKARGQSSQNKNLILKVSHHGSRTSTLSPLLSRLKPAEAWISNGVGNRFGHPATAVLERLKEKGVLVRRTDLSGRLTLTP